MSIFQKIDNWLFKTTTKIIRKWVAKKKFQKHKYDFAIRGDLIMLGLAVPLVLIAPVVMLLMQQKLVAAITHFTIWAAILTFRLWFTKTQDMVKKENYDSIFALRKHPEVYNAVKQICEMLFQDMRTVRLFFLKLTLGILAFWLFIITVQAQGQFYYLSVWAWVFVDLLWQIIDRYIDFVFDFDEPDQKKKAKEGVTELMKQYFQRLVQSLNPLPSPI